MKISALSVIGVGLLAPAVLVMAGWLLRSTVLLDAVPGARMVFYTAVCFGLVGVALAAESAGRAASLRLIRTIVGVAVASLGGLVLAEHVLARPFGIDLPELHNWLPDDNPHPGRMSPPTALGFVLTGVVLASMDRVTRVWSSVVLQALTTGVLLLGGIGLVGYALDFSLLFPGYTFREMALHTAFGFVLVAAGLWLAWRRMTWYADRKLVQDEVQRISLVGAAVLASIVCIAVLAVFAVTSSRLKQSAQDALVESLKGRVDRFRIGLEMRSSQAAVVAARQVLVEQMVAFEERPFEAGALRRLHAEAESALKLGFSAVAFYGRNGELRGAAGPRMERTALTLTIDGPRSSALLWQDGFLLRSHVTIERDGAPFGTMVAEQPLDEITKAFRSADEFAKTAELVVCRRNQDMLDCVRQRPEPSVFQVAFVPSLPIASGFAGGTGVVSARDYRGQRVLAAHAPIAGSGLAMVFKIDAAELYAPVRRQMYLVLALMAGIVAAGVWLLRRQIAPVVRRLVDSEERLALAVEGSQLTLWDFDVAAKAVYLDERWGKMLGGPAQARHSTSEELLALVHPEDVAALKSHVREVVQGAASHYDIEHRVRTASGEWLWIRSRGKVVSRDRSGRAQRLAGTNADIQRRKLAELQLAHQAGHDSLTGLPNRMLFADRLERAIARSRRSQAWMALLYLDVDKFKSVNDTYGHNVGDALIREFALRIKNCIRDTDTAARIGGDEFAVVLESLPDRNAALRIAQEIVEAMRERFALPELPLSVSASVGLAFYRGGEGVAADAIAKRADEALYRAKAAGRDTFRVSDEAAA